VHREQLVVRVRRQEGVLGAAQLDTKQQRLDSTQQEEEERRGAVEDPDALMVDGRDPAPEAGFLPVGRCLSVTLI
jgi:hypothetical protein